MKKIKALLLCIIVMITITCKVSSFEKVKNECSKTFANDFSKIEIAQFKYAIDKDTSYFNEVRYKCTGSSFYTKKVMFDTFGKWDKALYPKNERHPILLWENKYLSSQDTISYTIAATGAEEKHTIYTSFLAFDNAGNDLLNDDGSRKKLTSYFKKAIRSNDQKKKEFYDVYWKEVDSTVWKSLKKRRNL